MDDEWDWDENVFGEGQVNESASLVGDDLPDIVAEPPECRPPAHEIMAGIIDLGQQEARTDVAETAHELSALAGKAKSPEKDTCKVPPCAPPTPAGMRKFNECITRTYDEFVYYKIEKKSEKRVREFEDYMTHHGSFGKDDSGAHSTGGTPKTLREKIMGFIDDQNLDKVLNEGPIDWSFRMDDDSTAARIEDPKIALVVEDTYFPGVIDDAVHRKVDFNKLMFDMSFGGDVPEDVEEVPLTLMEAFDMRVGIENQERSSRMKQTVQKTPDIKKDVSKAGGFVSFLKDKDKNLDKVNREEVILSTAVDVDLNASLRKTPENDLTRAITCLQRAQVMNAYDKTLQVAEEAYTEAPDDLAESAAILKTKTFIAHVSEQKAMHSSKQYKPIEIVSYLGVTEPMPEDPVIPKSQDVKVGRIPGRANVSAAAKLGQSSRAGQSARAGPAPKRR